METRRYSKKEDKIKRIERQTQRGREREAERERVRER